MAELPELRAVEALSIVIGLFLAVFSGVYLASANGDQASFTETLDYTPRALLHHQPFSTVGFGDITPRTDTTRASTAVGTFHVRSSGVA